MHERNLFERRDIDIIVPVYESAELTTACLNSPAQHIDDAGREEKGFSLPACLRSRLAILLRRRTTLIL
jgi:hypothetical protein